RARAPRRALKKPPSVGPTRIFFQCPPMLTGPMQAAFFDLDKTVIAKSSVLAFGRPLYREGLLSRSALLKSAYNQAIYRLRGADECIASRSRVDAEGRYTGELEFYAYGPHKAAAIREAAERDGIDLAASYAYSDSITDAPMLEIVGHPVAVNPDRELARLAR